MKPRCSVFVATSLDGHIARQDGSIDGLLQANQHVRTLSGPFGFVQNHYRRLPAA